MLNNIIALELTLFLLGILKTFQEQYDGPNDDTKYEDEEGDSDTLHVHAVELVQMLAFRRFGAPHQQFVSHSTSFPQLPKPDDNIMRPLKKWIG
jgi:hypothetical protein